MPFKVCTLSVQLPGLLHLHSGGFGKGTLNPISIHQPALFQQENRLLLNSKCEIQLLSQVYWWLALSNEAAIHFSKTFLFKFAEGHASFLSIGWLKELLLRGGQSGEIFPQGQQDRVGDRFNLFCQVVLVVDA